jgi:hypothetical protein
LYFLFLLIDVVGVAVGDPSAPHLLLKKKEEKRTLINEM